MANHYEPTIPLEPYEDGYLVDRRDLLNRNLEARAVNPSTIRQFDGGFKPSMFEPIKIAFVESHARSRVYLDPKVWDGNNRLFWLATKGTPELFEQHQNLFPHGLLYVKDVTAALMTNHYIVPNDEYSEDAFGLTPVQFARSVVDNVKGREDATLARMAAHFVSIWPSMVGQELAKKYSVTAALMALSRLHEYASHDDLEELARVLEYNHYEFIAGETHEQRQLLQRAFLDLAVIAKASGVSRNELARYTFTMVISSNEAIGGESSRRKEILGLLYTPYFEKKLQAFYGDNLITAERQRNTIAQILLDVLKKDSPITQEIVNEVLGDTYISPSETALILRSSNPLEEYARIRFEAGFEVVKQSFQLTMEEMGISLSIDEFILTRLEEMVSTNTYRYAPKSHENYQILIQARQMLDDEQKWIYELSTLKDAYLEQGVNPSTFELERLNHESLLADLRGETSPRRMEKLYHEILGRRHGTLAAFTNEIETTQITNSLLMIADMEGIDVIATVGVADNMARNLRKRGLVHEEHIRAVLHLPQELRNQVLEGKVELATAIRQDKIERRQSPSPQSRQSSIFYQYPQAQDVSGEPREFIAPRTDISGNDIAILRNIQSFLKTLDADNLKIPEYLRPEMEETFNSLGRMLFSRDNASGIIKAYIAQQQEEYRKTVREVHRQELDKKRERDQ